MAGAISLRRHIASDHREVEVDGATYCGDPWCEGGCGYPRLVVHKYGRLYLVCALYGEAPVVGSFEHTMDWDGRIVIAAPEVASALWGMWWR